MYHEITSSVKHFRDSVAHANDVNVSILNDDMTSMSNKSFSQFPKVELYDDLHLK